jgi:hypothetical protein
MKPMPQIGSLLAQVAKPMLSITKPKVLATQFLLVKTVLITIVLTIHAMHALPIVHCALKIIAMKLMVLSPAVFAKMAHGKIMLKAAVMQYLFVKMGLIIMSSIIPAILALNIVLYAHMI